MEYNEFIEEAYEKICEICSDYNLDEEDAKLNLIYMIAHKCGDSGFHFHNKEIKNLIEKEQSNINILIERRKQDN